MLHCIKFVCMPSYGLLRLPIVNTLNCFVSDDFDYSSVIFVAFCFIFISVFGKQCKLIDDVATTEFHFF